jgi:hypothetical protein
LKNTATEMKNSTAELIRQKKEFMNLKAAILKLSNQRSKKEK